MPDTNLVTQEKDNLLYLIEASIGSPLFRHFYTKRGDETFDALKDGELSCAYYVTSLLLMCGHLIDGIHATVITTIDKMGKTGWYKIDKPQVGAIVHWPESFDDGTLHLGFYIGDEMYVSSHHDERVPTKHGANYRGRDPIAYYIHPKLL